MGSIKIDNISMVFTVPDEEDVHALNDVSLDIKSGEIVSVIGPSGCGKSTLLNIIAGFLTPTAGTVYCADKEVKGPGSDRGMVFQQGALFEWMNVEENIGFGLKMTKTPKQEADAKVAELLSIVGLQDFSKKPVYQLSGGMQQRVALARCLVNNPNVILMDEPLGALDALTREKMQGLVLKLWKETGKTIILITHSVEEALFLGEKLIVMAPRPGRILREYDMPFADQGLSMSPREIKASPEFVEKREEILSLIWDMEEQIMGSNNA